MPKNSLSFVQWVKRMKNSHRRLETEDQEKSPRTIHTIATFILVWTSATSTNMKASGERRTDSSRLDSRRCSLSGRQFSNKLLVAKQIGLQQIEPLKVMAS